MPKRNLSKPQPETPQKPALKTPKKPTPKRETKGAMLCRRELEAHYAQVGLTALENIVDACLALEAFTDILLQGDSAQSAIGDMLRLPVRKLREGVKEFPKLGEAHQKLEQANAQTHAYFAKAGKGGVR